MLVTRWSGDLTRAAGLVGGGVLPALLAFVTWTGDPRHDMHSLLERLTAVLPQVASQRLREDVARFADFARAWPGATIAELDAAALRVQGAS